MNSDRNASQQDKLQDAAVADTFPASDPPASMGTEGGARAVPADEMMGGHTPAPDDAVTLSRRFPTTEAAKLALEGLVRDGPLDRTRAELVTIGREIELRVAATPADAPRLQDLMTAA